jgi:hypothetical protein
MGLQRRLEPAVAAGEPDQDVIEGGLDLVVG